MKKEYFKKKSKIGRGSLAISQIIILVVSLIAFSYFIGSEFAVVSAAGGTKCVQVVDSKGISLGIAKVSSSEVDTQKKVTVWCTQNGGSAVCNGGSGKEVLREVSCPLEGFPSLQQPPAQKKPITTSDVLQAAALAKMVANSKKVETAVSTATNRMDGSPTYENAGPSFLDKIGLGKLGWIGKYSKVGSTAILNNLGAAAAIYAGTYVLLKQWLGVDAELSKAISAAASAGYLGYSAGFAIAKAAGAGTSAGPIGTIAGFIIAIAVIMFTGDTKRVNGVEFSCLPWAAPVGGKDCEKCNTGDFPCTEYKCNSLGQACELENKGTKEEICIWKNRTDVKPPVIRPWVETLTTGYNYNPDNTISPPDVGVKIVPGTNAAGCVAPWTPIRFGITLDKPGKCKIDTGNKNNFSDMSSFFGGSSTMKYNHSTIIPGIPSADSLAAENSTIANGGVITVYTRCQSANGYSNVENFIFRFCIDKGPDKEQPKIVTTSIENGAPVSFGKSSVDLQVYLNEPAECRWSNLDKSYDDMTSDTSMSCALSASEFNAQMLYKCSTTLTGLKDRVNNDFYFRCKDQPQLAGTNRASERNANTASYKFTLRGTQPLVIDSAGPNETTIKDSTDVIKVTLTAKTSAGFHSGDATCSYRSATTTSDSFVDFFNTGTFNHSQELWLPTGDYNLTIQCVDLGNNADNKSINFRVETDTTSPSVVRVFRQENQLRVVTNEEAQCVYSNFGCDYEITDGTNMSKALNGTEHSTAWNVNKAFYIKCSDKFGNRPDPNQCNIVARPFDIPVVK